MFKNTYTNTEQIYRDFYKYYLFRRPALYAFWIILISTYFMQLARNNGNWEIVTFFPLFMFMQIYTYRSKVKLSYKKASDLAGNAYEYTLTADERCITFYSTEGISYEIDYDRIRSFAKTNSQIILFTHSKKYYIFPVDCFTTGSAEEFADFLTEKQIKAEIYAK